MNLRDSHPRTPLKNSIICPEANHSNKGSCYPHVAPSLFIFFTSYNKPPYHFSQLFFFKYLILQMFFAKKMLLFHVFRLVLIAFVILQEKVIPNGE